MRHEGTFPNPGLRLRYRIDRDREHTLEEIGAVVRLSRERVRQVMVRALDKLRKTPCAQGFRSCA